MNKLFALAAALCFASSALAFDNEPEEGLSYQGFAGLNVSTLQNNYLGLGANVGVNLGARVRYVLPKAHGTYLSASLAWSQKGAKGEGPVYSEESDPTNESTSTLKQQMHYLELPIHVGFHYNLNDQLGFFAEVGPYFAVGVGGHSYPTLDKDGAQFRDIEDKNTWNSFQTSYGNFDSDKPYYQRWDAGIGFLIGAEYNKHYSLMAGFNWGLSDLYFDSFRDDWVDPAKFPAGGEGTRNPLSKLHNFNFSLTLGYRF